ncbi:MAG: hypothetical protein Kow0069_28850 [Promethearchaeota archaeon]
MAQFKYVLPLLVTLAAGRFEWATHDASPRITRVSPALFQFWRVVAEKVRKLRKQVAFFVLDLPRGWFLEPGAASVARDPGLFHALERAGPRRCPGGDVAFVWPGRGARGSDKP